MGNRCRETWATPFMTIALTLFGSKAVPWKESSSMSSRLGSACLAKAPGANVGAPCRAFYISPKTACKWLARFDTDGQEGLQAQSRRPQSSPARAPRSSKSLVRASGWRKHAFPKLDSGTKCCTARPSNTSRLWKYGDRHGCNPHDGVDFPSRPSVSGISISNKCIWPLRKSPQNAQFAR